MKRNLAIAGISAVLVLGGAMVAGAAKDNSQDDQFSFAQTEGQQIEQKMENGQNTYKVDLGDDNTSTSAQTTGTPTISFEEATEIALKKINGTITEIEKEFEHGRLEYKFEIESFNGEVDIHIDAETGKITEIDYDDLDHDDDDHRDD